MLIKCPECGSPISSKAAACPFCGYPLGSDENVNYVPVMKENFAVREAMNNSMNTGSVKASTAKPSAKGTVGLGIAAALSIAYLAYSIYYWFGVNAEVSSLVPNATQDSMYVLGEQLGAGIATALVFPHLICTGIGLLFNILAAFIKKRAFALTAGIIYSVAMILFLGYFYFIVIQAMLCYVAFAKMEQ